MLKESWYPDWLTFNSALICELLVSATSVKRRH